MIQKRDRRQHHGVIAIAAPDVRNLVRPGPESLAEQPVLPLPSLPYKFGTIRRLKRPLYGFVFRFTRNVMHKFPRAVTHFLLSFCLSRSTINQKSPSIAQAAPEAPAR